MALEPLDVGLGHAELQDAVLVPGVHVAAGDVANIEAALHGAGVALAADVVALLVLLILIYALGGADGQVAVVQLDVYLVLLEARQVDVQLVGAVGLADVGLHHVAGLLAVQLAVHTVTPVQIAVDAAVEIVKVIKEIIKKVFTKNARQHKSFLHSILQCCCRRVNARCMFKL